MPDPITPAAPATPAAPVTPAAPAATPAAPAAPVTPAAVAPVVPPATLMTPTEGTTPGESGKPTETAPAEIQIKIPDGVKVAPELLDSFKAFAKDNKISSEAAQKLVDQYIGAQQKSTASVQEQLAEQHTQWAEETKADKEIGGATFEANLATGQKAIRRFGTPELGKLLAETGLGNHKEVVRFFVRVGKQISEDRVPGTAPSSSEPDLLALMYPTMFEKKE